MQWDFFVQLKHNQQLHQILKRRRIWIEDLLNCEDLILFFISIELKAFCVTQNETPKMVKKNRLY